MGRIVRVEPGSLDGLSRWDRAAVLAVVAGDALWSRAAELPGGMARAEGLAASGWMALWRRGDGDFATLTPWAARRLGQVAAEPPKVRFRDETAEVEFQGWGRVVRARVRTRRTELEELPIWAYKGNLMCSPRCPRRCEFAPLPIPDPDPAEEAGPASEPEPGPGPEPVAEPAGPWDHLLLFGRSIGRLRPRKKSAKKCRGRRTA